MLKLKDRNYISVKLLFEKKKKKKAGILIKGGLTPCRFPLYRDMEITEH